MASLPPAKGIAFGGEPAMVFCCADEKKGNDFVQSLVYCAAVFVVEPRAERSGEVIGYGEVGGG
jgi:hypothetical protein